jgi:hypothetical protein
MSSAFYNRFNNNKVESFSDDFVFSSFSTADTDYIDASKSSTCTLDISCSSVLADCQCEYKNKVDELVNLKSTYGYSQKNLEDSNEIYSSVSMDSINLGIGILIMLATISYMNDII